MTDIRPIIKELRKLASGKTKPKYTNSGVCLHINLVFDINLETYIDFKKYPNFSGRLNFPVPHATLHPSRAYVRTENLWDKRTAYGKERAKFCAWCADELEKKYD